MKPEDVVIVIGQRYAIIDNTGDESLERFLRGTNRVVKIVRRAGYTFKAFIAEHYGYPIYSEWIKCWVPGVGELAEFSDGGNKWSGPHAFDGYLPNGIYSFRITGGVGFKYARPVQKKAEPAPDRNQTFEPAELGAMQEEKIAIDDDWRGHINVMMQELIARLEALEAKDEENQSWQKRFGDAVDRLTARMNLITEKVDMFSRPIYAINPNPFYVNTPDSDKAV